MSDSETNGNIGEQSGPSGSTEDLSEYTDADESVSAPTEILAEFLSAIMLKDYETALKYCKLILHYEPNNTTAREFYPFIEEKIELMKEQEESEDDSSSSDYSDSAPNVGSNRSISSGEESESKETDSDATSASYSSLEDEEADRENNVIEPGNTSLTSNDIANGNTETRKLSRNVTSGSEATRVSNANGNEELKRRLGGIIGGGKASAEQDKTSSVMRKRTNNGRLSNSNFKGEIQGDVKSYRRSSFSSYSSIKKFTSSPKHEISQIDGGSRGIYNSDSESRTGSTIHELKGKKSSSANK